MEMSLKLSDHVGRARLLFVSHSCSNYPLGSFANSMDNRTVGRRRYTSQIVSPLNFVDRRIHRRMRLGRIQDMLKVQGHMLRLSRESLDFIRGNGKMFYLRKALLYSSVVPVVLDAMTVDSNLEANSLKDRSRKPANVAQTPEAKASSET